MFYIKCKMVELVWWVGQVLDGRCLGMYVEGVWGEIWWLNAPILSG